jgi:hypothetical protein
VRSSLLSVVLIFLSTFSYGQSKNLTIKDFYGKWTVTEVVGYADVGAGYPHAKEIIGTVMVISADGITFGGDTCKPNAGFRVVKVDTAVELKLKAGARPSDAELPPKMVTLQGDPCIEVFWFNAHKIEFDDEGVFVRAYRD